MVTRPRLSFRGGSLCRTNDLSLHDDHEMKRSGADISIHVFMGGGGAGHDDLTVLPKEMYRGGKYSRRSRPAAVGNRRQVGAAGVNTAGEDCTEHRGRVFDPKPCWHVVKHCFNIDVSQLHCC